MSPLTKVKQHSHLMMRGLRLALKILKLEKHLNQSVQPLLMERVMTRCKRLLIMPMGKP